MPVDTGTVVLSSHAWSKTPGEAIGEEHLVGSPRAAAGLRITTSVRIQFAKIRRWVQIRVLPLKRVSANPNKLIR